jgi:hypothetical protein
MRFHLEPVRYFYFQLIICPETLSPGTLQVSILKVAGCGMEKNQIFQGRLLLVII